MNSLYGLLLLAIFACASCPALSLAASPDEVLATCPVKLDTHLRQALLNVGIKAKKTKNSIEEAISLAIYPTIESECTNFNYIKAQKLLLWQIMLLKNSNDLINLAITYQNLSFTCLRVGNYKDAIKYINIALKIFKKNKKKIDIADCYKNIAEIYLRIHKFQIALDYCQKGLEIYNEKFNEKNETLLETYRLLASIYNDIGDYTSALKYGELAENNFKKYYIGNVNLGTYKITLAQIYDNIGKYDTALALLNEAENIFIKNKSSDELQILLCYMNIASFYSNVGNDEKSLEYNNKALQIIKKHPTESQHLAASVYHNISMCNFNGNLDKAKFYAEKSLEINKKIYGESDMNTALNYDRLGLIHEKNKNYDFAFNLYNKSYKIKLKSYGKYNKITIISMMNIFDLYRLSNKYNKAVPLFLETLQCAMSLQSDELLASVLFCGMLLFKDMKDRETAIFFNKLSVLMSQKIRLSPKKFNPSIDAWYLSKKGNAYRWLSHLLTKQGRIVEAQQVLEMLKQNELYDYIVRDEKTDPRATRISFIGAEGALFNQFKIFRERFIKLYNSQVIFKNKKHDNETINKNTYCTTLKTQIKNGFNQFIMSIQNQLKSLSPQYGNLAVQSQLPLLEYLRPVLQKMDKGTALIHTAMTDNALLLLLTTGADACPLAYSSPISYSELSTKIRDFRQAIVDRKQDPRPLAAELYNFLIKPLEKELNTANITSLLLSLDGPLRYLPVAALHDGKYWLIEKFSLCLFTDAARDSLSFIPISKWSIAGLGTSKGHKGFSPLPSVRDELTSIVRTKDNRDGIIPGEYYLDEAFTGKRFEQVLHQNFSAVHLATHFDFKPGTVYSSSILLGDGEHLSLNALRAPEFDFQGKDMLTLSACNTAMTSRGNGNEMEGFAAMVQRKGVQSVLATLWPVADESTTEIMVDFYRGKYASNLTKAEALRQAQLKQARKALPQGTAQSHRKGPFPEYSHPYFWAPFILMGNWN